VVFGRAAAQRCGDTVEAGSALAPIAGDADDYALARLDKARHASGSTPTAQLRLRMQKAMQTNCAVFRTGEVLSEGMQKIVDIWKGSSDLRVADRSLIWNSDLIETLEYENLIAQSAVTVAGALNRTESRGAHAREDHPGRDDTNWMKHTLTWADVDAQTVRLGYRPVHNYTLTNEVSYIEPMRREY
jgi:succinate dehydrogenase / fumarate reductase flavoprotein subunit